jgi:valyl-tRNA synthetase
VEFLEHGAAAPRGTVVNQVNDSVDVLLTLTGNFDAAAEATKLEGEIQKKQASKDKIEREMADTDHLAKKPEEKRLADKERFDALSKEISQLEKDIENFRNLLD